jgi:hypothetical protein
MRLPVEIFALIFIFPAVANAKQSSTGDDGKDMQMETSG